MVYEGSERCVLTHHFFARWLQRATGFTVAGRRIRLSGPTGATVAVLRPETSLPLQVRPKKPRAVTPPTVTRQIRKEFAAPAPLPRGVRPAQADDLVGRWTAAGYPTSEPGYATFQPVNNWIGSDGCNDYGGRYAVGRGGRLLILDGPNGLVLCTGTPAAAWASETARVGVTTKGRLLLFAQHGRHIGMLVPKT
jgi:hypothetical protein